MSVVFYTVKVKQSLYGPGQAHRVLRKLRFPDFMTTAQDGAKVFYTVNLYICVFMTCSPYCWLYETLMDPWNVIM